MNIFWSLTEFQDSKHKLMAKVEWRAHIQKKKNIPQLFINIIHISD